MRLGTWITVPHPTIVDLVTDLPFDWFCVDLEHSPVSSLELQTAVSLIQAKGKRAFVRVAQNSHLNAKFPLDTGVDGIILPMVNSAEEARQAVSHCLYPPKGQRGVGLARAQRFGFGFKDHLRRNVDLEVIVQVEHVNAVREIQDIVEIDGVAGVFVGPYDLSGSMGIPGQFEDPRMKEAIAAVSKCTLARGKLLGAHVIPPSHEVVRNFENLGYNFIAFSIDTYFLGQKMRDELTALHRPLPPHS